MGPDGHELVIGFGQQVQLDEIVLHAGPTSDEANPLADSRGVGAAILEFSDGTEVSIELDEEAAMQTVPIGRQTWSLAIRSIAQGSQPVSIREVEFVGSVSSG